MAESLFYEIATGKSSAIIVSMVTCLSIWWIVTRWRERRNVILPPGPPSWPVVGTLPSMFQIAGFPDDNCFYNTLAQKYGSIYKLHIGSQLIFVVSNSDLIRAACTDSNIQDRPINAAYRKVFGRTADASSSVF
ncbi:Cytochrome P450 77A1 [Holothuria leucospilota]|uniref:Cytochrome P450 77A1 n=1 Tax=Holothuria leucospilota TaxID=206669 RepID=A0A9Q0Y8K5_HOLLE|nr:Cytochrome P450 77A1 [Holothuria leucospilota]